MKASLEYHNDLKIGASAISNQSVADRIVKGLDLPPAVHEFVRELVDLARKEWGDEAWALFDEYAELRILSVGWWIFHFTFRVKHCGALMTMIVGPRPAPEPEVSE